MTTTSTVRRRVRSADSSVARVVSPDNSSDAIANPPHLANDPHDALALAIVYSPPGELKSPKRALRKEVQRQMASLRASISQFGFLAPLLIDADRRIVCGHARWLAAKDLGLAEVPTIAVEHLSEEELRLYAIAENRIGELGEWDENALRLELGELALDYTLNLELTGFAMSEIDDFLIEPSPREDDDDEVPEIRHAPVTRRSDIWCLGEHRLLCGDALEEESYTRLLPYGEKAQMVFCDSPYNLPMKSISGKGKMSFEEFAFASGEMSRTEFTTFLTTAFCLMAAHSEDGAIHFQCMDWRHMREMLDAGEAAYSDLKNLVVWDKGKGGMGAFYRSQHELVFVWKVGKAKHINTFGLGETGRYRTNVWSYRGNNTFHASRNEELAAHPTVKPVDMVADAIRDCSHRGGIVLDAFGGSGSTLMAAERTGRRARLIEIDPVYCDRTIARWQKATGSQAVLESEGKSWSEVAASRGIDPDASSPVEAAACEGVDLDGCEETCDPYDAHEREDG